MCQSWHRLHKGDLCEGHQEEKGGKHFWKVGIHVEDVQSNLG